LAYQNAPLARALSNGVDEGCGVVIERNNIEGTGRRSTVGQQALRSTTSVNVPTQKDRKYSYFAAMTCLCLLDSDYDLRPSKPWVAGSSPAGGAGEIDREIAGEIAAKPRFCPGLNGWVVAGTTTVAGTVGRSVVSPSRKAGGLISLSGIGNVSGGGPQWLWGT
jgi:hypothetical protein